MRLPWFEVSGGQDALTMVGRVTLRRTALNAQAGWTATLERPDGSTHIGWFSLEASALASAEVALDHPLKMFKRGSWSFPLKSGR